MIIEDIIKEISANPYSSFFYTPRIYKKSSSYLLNNPEEIISAKTPDEIFKSLKEIDKFIKRGFWCYALINYEAGFAFEERLKKLLADDETELFKFVFFKKNNVEIIDSAKIIFHEDFAHYNLSNFHLNTTKEKFIDKINQIKNYIAEGDTYQVNYTVKEKFNFSGDLAGLFKNLIFNQSARYSAFINNGNEIIISISPELFFHIEGNRIIAKPMKGTAKRGININSDNFQSDSLRNSEKNRAENLMIVDLLRNDLGKNSEFGSVKVNELYTIEKYESLFQMISTIEAKLRDDVKFSDLIKNIFPCGSITGAPKIRTMEIINELETERRGLYTGAIGIVKDEEAVFNVTIRTIKINKKNGEGEIGLGSGIVWDSDPEKEYNEVLLKADFLTNPVSYFELIETMRVEKNEIPLLDDHLERLKNSAEYFLFIYDEDKIKENISYYLSRSGSNKIYRLRLLLNKYGKIKIEIKEAENNFGEVKIILSQNRISSENKFQYFKTTNRGFYNEEYSDYSSKGFFDVIYLNEKGEVAEGTISNIFIRRILRIRKEDLYLTPPVDSGILSGVYRKKMLREKPDIKEEILYKEDLLNADEIILTNAVKGEVKVSKFYLDETEFKEF